MKALLNPRILIILILFSAALLRFVKLASVPTSLFGDEVDLGYQAYSILKTGKDYQGNVMPINFHSIAEWRTPLYLYSAVPTVAVFGVSPLGIRLPAAIFGILNVWLIYLLTKKLLEKHDLKVAERVGLISALLMAISPWSLQYSRAGFEVTEMLFLLLGGVYFFFKSLTNSKYFWISVMMLFLTPLVYSTAKLFTPLIIISIAFIYGKEVLKFKNTELLKALAVGLLIGIPLVIGTLSKSGTQRIGDISVFTDPNMEQVVGYERNLDSKMGVPGFFSKLINNKFTYWAEKITVNYLTAYSPQFLFIKGDANMRQSTGHGMLYVIEIVGILAGFGYFFFEQKTDRKVKLFILSWLLISPFPSALTINGDTHATRLILMLPALIFLTALGWEYIIKISGVNLKKIFIILIGTGYFLSFGVYLRNYYAAYPIESAKWWHHGWREAVTEIKDIEDGYDRIIISMSGEPAWIFFAGHYEYDPDSWQRGYPIGQDVDLPGFGRVSHIDKFYFGNPEPTVQIYGLGKYIDNKTLYVANAKEHAENISVDSSKIPPGLNLLKTVYLPSGEPAMYLFSGKEN